MRGSSVWAVAVLLTPWWASGVAKAGCQTGAASAPYIGAADMRRIDRAAAHLPQTAGHMLESVGAAVPAYVKRKAVPRAVTKVLPQYGYPGYSAFRLGDQLAIADGQGTLSYILPLGGTQPPENCP